VSLSSLARNSCMNGGGGATSIGEEYEGFQPFITGRPAGLIIVLCGGAVSAILNTSAGYTLESPSLVLIKFHSSRIMDKLPKAKGQLPLLQPPELEQVPARRRQAHRKLPAIITCALVVLGGNYSQIIKWTSLSRSSLIGPKAEGDCSPCVVEVPQSRTQIPAVGFDLTESYG
jgi:hypothetical protein